MDYFKFPFLVKFFEWPKIYSFPNFISILILAIRACFILVRIWIGHGPLFISPECSSCNFIWRECSHLHFSCWIDDAFQELAFLKRSDRIALLTRMFLVSQNSYHACWCGQTSSCYYSARDFFLLRCWYKSPISGLGICILGVLDAEAGFEPATSWLWARWPGCSTLRLFELVAGADLRLTSLSLLTVALTERGADKP